MDRSLGTYPRGQGRAGLTGLRRFWGNTGGASPLLEKGQEKCGEADNLGVSRNDKFGSQARYGGWRGKRKSF